MKFTYLFSTYSLYTWVKFIWQHRSTKCGTPLFGLPDSLWQVFFAEAFNCSGRDPEQKRFSLRTAKAMHICSNPWCTFPTLAKYCFFFCFSCSVKYSGSLWQTLNGRFGKSGLLPKKKKKKVSYRNELFHAHPSVQINTPALSPPLYSGLIWHSFHHVFSHKISFLSLRLKHKFCNLRIRSCFSEQSTYFWSSPNHFSPPVWQIWSCSNHLANKVLLNTWITQHQNK